MPPPPRPAALLVALVVALAPPAPGRAEYVNFESSHVHPIALTPSRARLLVVNTPDARLEVLAPGPSGELALDASIPVGLEPVSVLARGEDEAWVVNRLSDSVSVVDLARRTVVRTLRVGDEPADVAFAGGRAFVAVGGEDVVKVFDLADLAAPPAVVPVFSRSVRALAAAPDGSRVYAVPLHSGNGTTALRAQIAFDNVSGFVPERLAALGLEDMTCDGAPPPYPPLPAGIVRNPLLVDPADGVPRVSVLLRWEEGSGRWLDDAGQDWTRCVRYRLADLDLFAIDAASLSLVEVPGLGTTLFDVSVNPASGRVYVTGTEARNHVRFEHPLGVSGHVVDNEIAIVDPAAGWARTRVDLNAHVDRRSDPATNLAERRASLSQPGMLAWSADGATGYLTAIGSGKVFVVDGGCASGGCIFGPDRASPRAVEVGEGPSGLALDEGRARLYVLNRFTNSVAVVDTASLAKLGERALHDPVPADVRAGRALLYDAVRSSAHGDAACSSCHVSGDADLLAWDLGNPAGDLVRYDAANDNVRFITPFGGQPVACPPALCSTHQGFDPQKGPMTTQSLRGMLEPLHWRGDRATFLDFNPAFVGLLGAADVGPVAGRPAGLPAIEMERLRRFALGLRFPPNPHRSLDDTLPDADVPIPGTPLAGNPARGEALFRTRPSDSGQPCVACHADPFGAAGGVLGGLDPAEPTSPLAPALFDGRRELSDHSDLKVPHLRNVHARLGPPLGTPAAPALARTGFGLTHDGSVPDLLHFLSHGIFTLSAADSARELRDIASFVLHFPTETRPCVGRQVTLPPGAPPTGAAEDEAALDVLLSIADPSDPARHGELVAWTVVGGGPRTFAYAAGEWTPDRAGDPPLGTAALRAAAEAPLTFTCVPTTEGARLGLDVDRDGARNGDDCAPGDPALQAGTLPATGLKLVRDAAGDARLSWDEQATRGGPTTVYDVAGGDLAGLRSAGVAAATACRTGGLPLPAWTDGLAGPPPGGVRFYQVRARNGCGPGGFGPGWEAADPLDCR